MVVDLSLSIVPMKSLLYTIYICFKIIYFLIRIDFIGFILDYDFVFYIVLALIFEIKFKVIVSNEIIFSKKYN